MRAIAPPFVVGISLLTVAGCKGDPSATASDNQVLAVPSVSGVVSAMVGGSGRTVTLAFNTSDGLPAADLQVVSNLSNLPAGWTAPTSSFGCATVSTGNGCVLPLTFAPTTDSSGTLNLGFTYTNNAGASEGGILSVSYAATEHDNVVGTAAPAGQLTAVVGSSVPVTVTFNTDDGNTATAFALTSSLTTLPTEWSSQTSSLSCGTVSTGTSCRLALTYAPASYGSGTVSLSYSYTDNAGSVHTGTVTIPYSATTDDNAVATDSLSTVMVGLGSTQPVTVTFTTDDGNPASSLSISSTTLGSLPNGWSSGSNAFSCVTFSTGNGCQLDLSFAPSTSGSGTLQLPYNYVDNAGNAKTGTATLIYGVTQQLYVADQQLGVVKCTIGSAGALSGCASTGSGFQYPVSVAFYNNSAYVTDVGGNAVDLCPVAADGTLGSCASVYSTPQTGNLEVHGSYLYVPWGDASTSVNGPTVCSINQDGRLGGCTETGADPSETSDVAFFGQDIYVSTYAQHGAGLLLCSAGSGGSISNCSAVNTGQYQAFSTFVSQNHLYMTSNSGVTICVIASDGTLSGCNTSMPYSYGGTGWTTQPSYNLVISNGYAYLSYHADNFNEFRFAAGIAICSVGSDGSLSGCTDSGASLPSPYGIALH